MGCGHGKHDHADKNVVLDLTIVLEHPVDSLGRDSVLVSIEKYIRNYVAEQTKIDASKFKPVVYEDQGDKRVFRIVELAFTGSVPRPRNPPPPPLIPNVQVIINNRDLHQIPNFPSGPVNF
jgi:hypothetical protein